MDPIESSVSSPVPLRSVMLALFVIGIVAASYDSFSTPPAPVVATPQAQLAQAAGASANIGAPQNCTEAIQKALGKIQDPAAPGFDKGESATLDACFGAVLKEGKSPSQNPADYECVGRSGTVKVGGAVTTMTNPDPSIGKGHCEMTVCTPNEGNTLTAGNLTCSAAKVYGSGDTVQLPPGAVPPGTNTPAPTTPQPATNPQGAAAPWQPLPAQTTEQINAAFAQKPDAVPYAPYTQNADNVTVSATPPGQLGSVVPASGQPSVLPNTTDFSKDAVSLSTQPPEGVQTPQYLNQYGQTVVGNTTFAPQSAAFAPQGDTLSDRFNAAFNSQPTLGSGWTTAAPPAALDPSVAQATTDAKGEWACPDCYNPSPQEIDKIVTDNTKSTASPTDAQTQQPDSTVPLPQSRPSALTNTAPVTGGHDETTAGTQQPSTPTPGPGDGGPKGGGGGGGGGGGNGGGKDQTTNNGGGLGSGAQSFLNGLMQGLAKALSQPQQPPAAPAQACSTDPNTYAQQQQQYQQQLQQYNYQLQQAQYQQQMSQYYGGNSYPAALPAQPTPCSPSTQQQCSVQPQQPDPSTCTGGSWSPQYSGSCIVGWQCSNSSLGASLSCSPTTADVGSILTFNYSCAQGTATSSSFIASGSSGTATTTVAASPAGTNTATYSLSCASGSQTSSAQCSVQVNHPTIVLVANPSTISAGGTSLIGWTTSGMQSCRISSPSDPTFTAQNSANTSVSGSVQTPALTTTTQFDLTCTTVGGGTATSSTIVTIPGTTLPGGGTGTGSSFITASSTVDGGTLNHGDTVTIDWNSSGEPSNAAVALWLFDIQTQATTAVISGGQALSGSYTWHVSATGATCQTDRLNVCDTDLVAGHQYAIEADVYMPQNAYVGDGAPPANPIDPTYGDFFDAPTFTVGN
jgi:hypothetical protein